ncbi:unnamed protein product [Lepeophtheirus salmonis]|uniref:(salmon louse) hypothetical protein n=1 Tax=Lepeophtheirus salmonis TaxID=72036 RepID=A0A7R8CRY1_LEPSM|nr:unnamed protein product [Lepeophtheirus salmonis]CAF2872252.1 unnamed protein product [Lepeophtheirus salmonis]
MKKSKPSPEVSHVVRQFKICPFWPSKPKSWFRRLEVQFNFYRITEESESSTSYSDMKAKILDEYKILTQNKTERLLQLIEAPQNHSVGGIVSLVRSYLSNILDIRGGGSSNNSSIVKYNVTASEKPSILSTIDNPYGSSLRPTRMYNTNPSSALSKKILQKMCTDAAEVFDRLAGKEYGFRKYRLGKQPRATELNLLNT